MKRSLSDRRFVMALAAVLLGLILAVSFLSPNPEDNDPSPTTYNTGSAGTKAAYLLLNDLGYLSERWEEPSGTLRSVDASKTTLILADPVVPEEDLPGVRNDIADFLSRGGRVLVTGIGGAYLIPGAHTTSPTQLYKDLCYTTPEGQGPLAQAGQVSIADTGRWAEDSPASRVQQWCGKDAVVVSFKAGVGEAIWWSSPMPLTNRGLKEDASLKLLLASVGQPGRRVLFDEYFHGVQASLWDTAKGLPIRALAWQSTLVGLLLVLSYGRRNGPLRMPVRSTRSSPLEFAESMGQLYHKAGATQVATDCAKRRLFRFLYEQCGIPRQVLSSSPDAIVEAVQNCFGGDWSGLGTHLAQASTTEYQALSSSTALALVKALDQDLRRLLERIRVR